MLLKKEKKRNKKASSKTGFSTKTEVKIFVNRSKRMAYLKDRWYGIQ